MAHNNLIGEVVIIKIEGANDILLLYTAKPRTPSLLFVKTEITREITLDEFDFYDKPQKYQIGDTLTFNKK